MLLMSHCAIITNLLVMILDRILYVVLMHEIGLNCVKLVAFATLGISVTKVALTYVGRKPPLNKNWMACMRSTPIIPQKLLKKAH